MSEKKSTFRIGTPQKVAKNVLLGQECFARGSYPIPERSFVAKAHFILIFQGEEDNSWAKIIASHHNHSADWLWDITCSVGLWHGFYVGKCFYGWCPPVRQIFKKCTPERQDSNRAWLMELPRLRLHTKEAGLLVTWLFGNCWKVQQTSQYTLFTSGETVPIPEKNPEVSEISGSESSRISAQPLLTCHHEKTTSCQIFALKVFDFSCSRAPDARSWQSVKRF